MRTSYRKYLILALAITAIAMVTAACGSATPTGDCLVPQNGVLVASDCTVPAGVTPEPTATPLPVTPTPGSSDPAVAAGIKVVQANGCSACHSTNGSAGVGPTWKGLYGSTVTLNDGTTVTANDAYIHESIVDPSAKIVKGFSDGIMPQNFGTKLSDQDISNIIAYIKTLK